MTGTGVQGPSVAYVGAASGDNRSFFRMLSNSLQQCGAGQVILAPLAGRRTSLDQTRAILEAADLVFVSGGDVEQGMRTLEQRKVLPMLRTLYESGKPFFGLSAGSIMLARQWITWPDPDDETSAQVFDCMGLAPLLCDTHGEADGWEELIALLLLNPEGTVGYGIPSGAGLAVHPDGTLKAMDLPVHRYVNQGGQVLRMADLSS